MSLFLIAGVVLLVVLGLVAASVVVVPNGQAYVVERLGRVAGVLQAGLHVVPPFLTRVAARVPLGEQTLDVPAAPCCTRDNATATCGGSVVVRVLDPALAASAVSDYRSASVQAVAQAWLRTVAASDLVEAAEAMGSAHRQAEAALAGWGVVIVRAQPLLRLSDEAMRRLEGLSAREREARVAEWATKRGQKLGPDGRPSASQRMAYDDWLAQERRAHQREIDAARKKSGEA
jgi:hypothetical protein